MVGSIIPLIPSGANSVGKIIIIPLRHSKNKSIKDGASYCFYAYALRISRWSKKTVSPNTEVCFSLTKKVWPSAVNFCYLEGNTISCSRQESGKQWLVSKENSFTEKSWSFGSLSNSGLFSCLIDAIVIGGLFTIATLLHFSALLWQNRLCCQWHRFCLACAFGGIVSWLHSPVRCSYPSTTHACAAPLERLLSIMMYCYNGILSRQLSELSSAYCHWLITIGHFSERFGKKPMITLSERAVVSFVLSC